MNIAEIFNQKATGTMPRYHHSVKSIKRAGKSFGDLMAKLLVVKATADRLAQLKQASEVLAGLYWLSSAAEKAMQDLTIATGNPWKVVKRADAVLDSIRELKDDITIEPEKETEFDPHSEIYLACSMTIILDDIVMKIKDKNKLRLLEPLHEAAVNIEILLDKDLQQYDARKAADEFVERVYLKIEEV